MSDNGASRGSKGKTLWVIVRSLLGIGLLVGVVLWLDPAEIFASLAAVRRGPLIVAFVTQVLARVIWTYRWQAILGANQIERRFWDLFAMLHIGLFFNTFLPSSVGGDVVRGYYASRGGKDRAVVSYLSVIIERFLGLGTFAAMAAVASLVALAGGSTPLPDRLLVSVAAVGIGLVAGVALLFSWQGWVAVARRLPVPERWIDDLRQGLELFRRPETPRFAILASSLALKLIAILLYALCGRALGLELSPTVYFLVVPAAAVAAMLPVTLNGLGVRESVMAGLLAAFGAPKAAAGAMALLGLAVITSFALAGGIFYVFYRSPRSDD